MGRSETSTDDEQPRSLDWADNVRLEPDTPEPRRAGAAHSAAGVAGSLRGKRFGVLAGAALIVALAGAGVVAANAFGGADAPAASSGPGEKRLADLDAEVKRRTDALAELERRHAAKEGALADATERLAKLEQRKQALEREIAELVAPVSGPDAEREAQGGDPGKEAAAAPSDPSPPDEDVALREPTRTADGTPIEPAAARADADAATQDAVPVQESGATRVFIHVRSADPAARERARAVADELRRRGVAVAEIRGVRYPVRKDAVRYFYDADRAVVETLQQAVREASAPGDPTPQAQDFRAFRAPPRQGTLELWLS